MAINNTSLTTAEQTLISGSTAGSAILGIWFSNHSALTATITIYMYPSSISSGGTNCVTISTLSIPPSDTYFFNSADKVLLASGDKLTALASANSSITATVSYYNM